MAASAWVRYYWGRRPPPAGRGLRRSRGTETKNGDPEGVRLRCAGLRDRSRRNVPDTGRPSMADTTTVLATPPVSEADLARAEEFTREPFLHEGEDLATVLAEGTPRRRALDDALAEIEAGRKVPSVEWRREYSLMLGLERLLSQDEPHLKDRAVLSAHQVDALSGTLIALFAEAQAAGRNGNGGGNGRVELEELPSRELEIEGDEDLTEDEPLDWDAFE